MIGRGPWLEGYNVFEFEVIEYRDEYLIARVAAVHVIDGYSVGGIIYMKIPKTQIKYAPHFKIKPV